MSSIHTFHLPFVVDGFRRVGATGHGHIPPSEGRHTASHLPPSTPAVSSDTANLGQHRLPPCSPQPVSSSASPDQNSLHIPAESISAPSVKHPSSDFSDFVDNPFLGLVSHLGGASASSWDGPLL